MLSSGLSAVPRVSDPASSWLLPKPTSPGDLKEGEEPSQGKESFLCKEGKESSQG